MTRPRNRFLLLCLLAATLLVACDRTRVYDNYCHTPLSGWEKADPVEFAIPPVAEAGDYAAVVGLRISETYPFTNLALVAVVDTWHAADTATTQTISLSCPLFSKEGHPLGAGLTYWQYDFPLAVLHLQQGDSLHVAIRPDMKRDFLPGINDVGFSLTKTLR